MSGVGAPSASENPVPPDGPPPHLATSRATSPSTTPEVHREMSENRRRNGVSSRSRSPRGSMPGESMPPPTEVAPNETARRSALRRPTLPVPERPLPPELLTPEATARRMLNGLDILTHIRTSLDSIKRLHENLCAFASHQVELQNSMIDAIEHMGTNMGVFMPARGHQMDRKLQASAAMAKQNDVALKEPTDQRIAQAAEDELAAKRKEDELAAKAREHDDDAEKPVILPKVLIEEFRDACCFEKARRGDGEVFSPDLHDL
eukprot:s2423_g10.t1